MRDKSVEVHRRPSGTRQIVCSTERRIAKLERYLAAKPKDHPKYEKYRQQLEELLTLQKRR